MTNHKNDCQKIEEKDEDEAAERGRKVIDAGKVALRKKHSDPETIRQEQQDAENWHSEG